MEFDYWTFALALMFNGIGMGLFAAPNRAGIMNSLPPNRRGVGAGMSAHGVSALDADYLTGRGFFPTLISGPFSDGPAVAFGFAIIACLVAAAASSLRGGKYAYTEASPAPA